MHKHLINNIDQKISKPEAIATIYDLMYSLEKYALANKDSYYSHYWKQFQTEVKIFEDFYKKYPKNLLGLFEDEEYKAEILEYLKQEDEFLVLTLSLIELSYDCSADPLVYKIQQTCYVIQELQGYEWFQKIIEPQDQNQQ
ncbi:UNKNOWN [Stylonychia lemnae]|uniref:Uncharacterized protein n=1 Tax=Stylonychia lemnae TaxID=5949 RepID=A0A077ZR23_STYLE|nr:UNKNOWN [Stylonychia lemnae]|eukprot:CDW72337.1 UNKNOWN [Stylonychia lemnae]